MDTHSLLAILAFGIGVAVTIIRLIGCNMPEGLSKDVYAAYFGPYVLGGYIVAYILMGVALVMKFCF